MKHTNKLQQHSKKPRFLTIVLLIALFSAILCCGYVVYKIFLATPVFVDTKIDTLFGRESAQLQSTLDELEQRKQELRANGDYIFFGNSDTSLVVTGNENAEEIFFRMQSEYGFSDANAAFKLTSIAESEFGTVYTFQQYYNGLEVYGHQKKMSVNDSGEVNYILGECAEIIDFDTSVPYDHYDSATAVEQYLKQNYQLASDEVNIEYTNTYILYDEDGEPFVAYRFEVGMYEIFVEAESNTVISENLIMISDMISMDLQGQYDLHKDVDVYQENEKLFLTQDTERGINCYWAKTAYNYGEFFKTNGQVYKATDFDTAIGQGVYSFTSAEGVKPNMADALYYAENAYDYLLSLDPAASPLLSRRIEMVSNFFYLEKEEDTDTHLDKEEDTDTYKVKWNDAAYMGSSSDAMYFAITAESLFSENDTAAYFDTVAHEMTHAVVDNVCTLNNFQSDDKQKSKQYAVNEGLADLFGELAECSVFGSTDWRHGSRVAYDRSGNGCLYDFNQYSETVDDCHSAATLLSYPACMMNQGINGDESLSIESLGTLWYNAILLLDGNSGFEEIRRNVEMTAENMYYRGALTASQVECVIDAFDRVGIEPKSALYKITPGSVMRVVGRNQTPVTNVEIQISSIKQIIYTKEKTSSDGLYSIPTNLKPGIYTIRVSCGDEFEEFCVYVNDNDDTECLVSEYQTTWTVKMDVEGKSDNGNKNKKSAQSREIVLVLDASGSMAGDPINQVRSSAHDFVENVLGSSGNTKISLVTYSDGLNVLLERSDDQQALDEAIDSIVDMDMTNMYAGLGYASEIAKKSTADRRMIVLMSDGLPNAGTMKGGSYNTALIDLADDIKEDEQVFIYAMGFFSNLSGTELSDGIALMRAIASSGYYYNVSNDGIEAAFSDMASLVNGDRYKVITVACPVDVEVSYMGETLSSAEENYCTRTSFGSLSFVGEGDDQEKVIRIREEIDCDVTILGTGRGTMDLTIQYPDRDGDYTDTRIFEDIPITKKTTIVTNTAQGVQTELKIDSDGNGKYDTHYTALYNQEAFKGSGLLIYAAVIIALILVVEFLKLLCRAVRHFKHNHTCPVCGRWIGSDSLFCPEDGTPIVRIPLLREQKLPHKPQSAGVAVLKMICVFVLVLIIAASVLLERLPSGAVYQSFLDGDYEEAQNLYVDTVERSSVNKFVLNLELEQCMGRVNTALEEKRCTPKSAATFYEAVAALELSDASACAEEYLGE